MPKDNPDTTMGEEFPETVIIADVFRFAGAEDVDVAVTVYPVIGLPQSLIGGTNETLTVVGPVGVATIEVHGPGAERHETPGQFSKEAFFQRTLSSSRLKNAFRLMSNGCFSLFVFSPMGISTFGLVCPMPNKGSSKKGKTLGIIL